MDKFQIFRKLKADFKNIYWNDWSLVYKYIAPLTNGKKWSLIEIFSLFLQILFWRGCLNIMDAMGAISTRNLPKHFSKPQPSLALLISKFFSHALPYFKSWVKISRLCGSHTSPHWSICKVVLPIISFLEMFPP